MKTLTVFLFFMLLSFSSCGLLKQVTTERTVIITQIDTVLHINIDGYKPLVNERPMYDTVTVEAQTGTAIAYVDPIRSVINLSFLPKTFDVPIVINQKTKHFYKEKTPMEKLILKIFGMILGFMVLVLGFGLWYINRKLSKIMKLWKV